MRYHALFSLRLFFALSFCVGLAAEDNRWRAGAEVLAERVERLAAGGEVQAAATVLQELLGRKDIEETGLDDRARMAVAKGVP